MATATSSRRGRRRSPKPRLVGEVRVSEMTPKKKSLLFDALTVTLADVVETRYQAEEKGTE